MEKESTLFRKLNQLIYANPDLSLKVLRSTANTRDVGFNDNFFNHLMLGKIAMFEPDYFTQFQRCIYCKERPGMRWHEAIADLPHIILALGHRKDLDNSIL